MNIVGGKGPYLWQGACKILDKIGKKFDLHTIVAADKENEHGLSDRESCHS